MNYRKLGATGLSVSEIGMGCEGFNEESGEMTFPLMERAEALGVNFIDLYSPNPTVRSNLGRALAGRRDKFILQAHLCSVWKNGQYERTRDIGEVKAGFSDLLTRLRTDFVEIGMIHYVDSPDDWKAVAGGPVMRYARELKAAGKIGHIGLSSHNPAVALEAAESGLIEVLMFSVNPCYDLLPAAEDVMELWNEKNYAGRLVNMEPQRERLYETCQRLGVGISVMKAFGGGDLLSEELSPAGKALTPLQCIHYALTRPAAATVLVGAHTVRELEESVRYETAAEAERDYAAAFATFPKISWQGHCMYCGHCAPCPKGIDVASVTKLLNLARAQSSVPETVRGHYELLTSHAGDCVSCGACEKRCPFGVTVTENMKQAKKIFGL